MKVSNITKNSQSMRHLIFFHVWFRTFSYVTLLQDFLQLKQHNNIM
jgi:hypothetical protein